ncbi:MAG TPA: cytochrome o ubiquinol oxidase subunit IV [Gammaproteobacteria bacterium]|nr:cytochrome o ubiquinol oxidase subunit IV [Gammaproteobacteria bacterium]
MSTHADVPVTENYGTSPKTLSAYIIGLFLSLLLTVIAFLLVGKHMLSNSSLYIAVSILAVIQFCVQSLCFLRLNAGPEGRWNLYPFMFAVFVVFVVIGGSLWIMYNLNYNMMAH